MTSEYIFIPARAGSKGLPKKNKLTLHGRSLVGLALDFVGQLGWSGEVVLSSDDDEILATETNLDVVRHHRPPHLATDTALISNVIIDYFQINQPDEIDNKIIIYLLEPTAPLRTVETFHAVRAAMISNGRPAVVTVSRDHGVIYENFNELERTIKFSKKGFKSNRQIRGYNLREANSVFATTLENLRINNAFKSPTMGYIEISPYEAIDINTQNDFSVASAIYNILKEGT